MLQNFHRACGLAAVLLYSQQLQGRTSKWQDVKRGHFELILFGCGRSPRAVGPCSPTSDPSKDVLSQALEAVTLCSKRVSAHVNQLRVWRWGFSKPRRRSQAPLDSSAQTIR